jgi:hypothetical protein
MNTTFGTDIKSSTRSRNKSSPAILRHEPSPPNHDTLLFACARGEEITHSVPPKILEQLEMSILHASTSEFVRLFQYYSQKTDFLLTAEDACGKDLLYYAIGYDKPEIVSFLVSKGAIEAAKFKKRCPLTMAQSHWLPNSHKVVEIIKTAIQDNSD